MTLLDTRNEPVREMRMEPANRTTALISVIERLVTNPATDVDKLQKMIELQERLLDRQAQDEFRVAMADAQKEMRAVTKDAFNKQTNSWFASAEALDDAIRPIYTKHGFSLSFDTAESPLPEHVRVVCEAAHRGGFVKSYHLDVPADGKGARGGDFMSKTHAAISAVTYGMRTLNRMVWNIATGEGDDDGNSAGETREKVEAPKGFEDWWHDLKATGDTGRQALSDAFNASKPEYRIYLTKHHNKEWEDLKRKAAEVTAKAKAGQK